ncbi:DUF1648 domain-containing protein [Paenibacillus cineris]|uniref:Membrane protein n=1 Tax=Paenibacillus cineris TaxID=237530 RepID=A0ABQ4LJ22_9BACL|nr:DUF5808 domain-containing protein [Paenibacillus cineris]GIO56512.1 membrane protein [Paenibacillus cineris]
MYWISVLFLIAMFVPLSLSLICMPYLTRETVSFGVSVSEAVYHSAPLRRMRRQYVWTSSVAYGGLLIACLLAMLTVPEKQQPSIISGFVVLLVAASAVINLIFYTKMKRFKATLPPETLNPSVVAVDTSFRSGNKLVWSNKWFLIHGAVALISAALALAYYDKIPDTLNMKFNWQGEVTRTAAKSYRTVLGLNLMQLVMIGIFMTTNWSILRSKQQLDPANPQQSVRRNAAFRRRWSMFNVAAGLMMVLLFSFVQYNMIYPLSREVMMLVSLMMPLLIVVLAIVLAFSTGQGGRRIGGPSSGSGATHVVNDDKYWKLGNIYFNPQDPALFVEKRMGIGWTVNFGRPGAWIFLVGILAVIIIAARVVS